MALFALALVVTLAAQCEEVRRALRRQSAGLHLVGRFAFWGYWKSMEPWNKCVWCSGGHWLVFKPFLVFVATWAPNAVYAAKVHLLPIAPNTLPVGPSQVFPGLVLPNHSALITRLSPAFSGRGTKLDALSCALSLLLLVVTEQFLAALCFCVITKCSMGSRGEPPGI